MKRYIQYIGILLVALMVTRNVWGQTEVPENWAGGDLSGSFKLKGNTYLKSPIKVLAGKTLTIDLNGMVLSGTEGTRGTSEEKSYMIRVERNGILIINDSNPNVGHAGYIDDKGLFRWSGNGPFSVFGGIIYNPYKDDVTNSKGISVAGTCTINGAKIMGCYANQIGAAVTVTSSGKFTMEQGEVRYNYAKGDTDGKRGGVIYAEPCHDNQGGIINIANSTISNNQSEGNGGAICGFQVTLDHCIIEYNSTTKNGGAIYVRNDGASSQTGFLDITNCTIGHNRAGGSGGGIYVNTEFKINTTKPTEADIEKSIIEFNEANSTGGGIYNQGPTTIDKTQIRYNYARINGGGIESKNANTTISNSKILGNRAMETETGSVNHGRGGGFNFLGDDTDPETSAVIKYILDNTEVTENACMYYGGGGQVREGAKLILKGGSKINNNTCILKGAGGLHISDAAAFDLLDGEISKNTSLGGVGGGIHSSYKCSINLEGGKISDNVVFGRGGGVHINTGGELILNGTDITGNKAYDGYNLVKSEVYQGDDGIYTWTKPEYSSKEDTYPGYGGGILINSGTCTMKTGDLSGNYAETFGGGIGLVMLENSTSWADYIRVVNFTLEGGTVSNNTTDGNGGAVYLMKNTISEKDKEFKDKFDEEILTGIPTITLKGGIITENKAKSNGGATYQDVKTNFYIETGTKTVEITNNEAGYQNSPGSGGAAYIAGGNVHIKDGNTVLSNNKALNGDGGGIYCEGNFTVENAASVQVYNNEAKNGGGVCVKNGAVSLPQGESCKINNNKATELGGGLYVHNNGGTKKDVTCSGGLFTSNTAKYGGGACVDGSIDLTIASSFEGNSAYNGGAIYMMNRVNMEFGKGIIRSNMATNIENASNNSISTAKGATYIDGLVKCNGAPIYGVGGGIFMDNNTTLEFTDITNFGLYNNMADCAADDIFVNGNGNAKVILPDTEDPVNRMDLTGFKVPGGLYWVEDFPNEDRSFTGDAKLKKKRYTEALNINTWEFETFDKGSLSDYACITLGYELVHVELVKNGLQEGDDVTFTLYYLENGTDELKPYRKVILTGVTGNKDVIKKIALPSAKWKFEESGWGWKYDSPTYHSSADFSESSKLNSSSIEISRNKNNKIYIKNRLKSGSNNIKGAEHYVRNLMKPGVAQ